MWIGTKSRRFLFPACQTHLPTFLPPPDLNCKLETVVPASPEQQVVAGPERQAPDQSERPLPDPNRTRSAPPGPEQQALDGSGPCTQAASSESQWPSLGLNSKPQIECQNLCQVECHKDCQYICYTVRQNDRMPNRLLEHNMAARMSEHMKYIEYMSDSMIECDLEYQNKCQVDCQIGSQIECQNRCQIGCQARCQDICPKVCLEMSWWWYSK